MRNLFTVNLLWFDGGKADKREEDPPESEESGGEPQPQPADPTDPGQTEGSGEPK